MWRGHLTVPVLSMGNGPNGALTPISRQFVSRCMFFHFAFGIFQQNCAIPAKEAFQWGERTQQSETEELSLIKTFYMMYELKSYSGATPVWFVGIISIWQQPWAEKSRFVFTQVASLVCLSTLEYNNTTGENKTKIIVPIIRQLNIVNFEVQQEQARTRRYKLLVVQCTCLHSLQQETKTRQRLSFQSFASSFHM